MRGAERGRVWIKLIFVSAGIILVCLMTLGIFFFVSANWPRAHETARPLSLSEFRREFGEAGLPVSASNICYAQSSVAWTGGARIYRFDAPVQDCMEYSRQMTKESNRQSDLRNQVPTEPVAILARPEQIDHSMLSSAYGLRDTSWFDVENILQGFEGRGPPYGLSHFWIDSDRGRFYYYWTD